MKASPGLLLLLYTCLPVLGADLRFVEIDPAGTTMLRQQGGAQKPFVAVGLNYFDHHTGWAPKLWQQFDEGRVARQLTLIRDQGFNTVRVFLTFSSFHRFPGQVYEFGERRFRRFLELCRQRGIYVIPSGPDHWEGTPDWRVGKDAFADETLLKADEEWWAAFTTRFKDDPTILAWDLLNEPMVSWDTPPMRVKWNEWLAREYRTADQIAAAWNRPAGEVGSLGAIAPPPPQAALNDARLFDYQRFRESLGDDWTRRHATAIRSADPRHLVTVGHIQWVAPIYIPQVQHYAGFNMQSNAQLVDFVSVHFYPLAQPRPCDSPEGIQVNAAYLEALLYQCSAGKPLMIGEFNWYGGGGLDVQGTWSLPPKPPEHQVEWCQELLAVSRGRVFGWLNWAFADTPTSRDITRWSGLWNQALDLKPWGQVFGEFARQVTQQPPEPRPFPEYLTNFEFDRKAMLTSPEMGAKYRQALVKARQGN